jgi:outer membrane biosynthesis protein TonB
MKVGKNAVLAIAVIALLAGVGCKKKKPNLPPQTQPPTITQPAPETTPPAQTPVETAPPATTPPVTEPEPQPAPPPKPKHNARRKRPHVPAESKPSEAKTPPKPATETKSNENVQISAEIPQNLADKRRKQTEDLLNVAEANLRKINYSMTDGEQAMQRQVRNFITQSRLAIQDGDFERAYNLASKAQQLSQGLVK